MNFDDLEKAWATQQPPRANDTEIKALQSTLRPELRRRTRFNAYAVFVTGLFAVVTPLLAVANRHYENPIHHVWYGIHAAVWTLLWLILLGYAWKRLQRHRALARQPVGDLHSMTRVSLSSLEAEIHDCRVGAMQVLALLPVQLITLYVRFSPTEFGFYPFALRAGIALGVALALALPLWRHYRVNLLPALQRQRELLREFEDGAL